MLRALFLAALLPATLTAATLDVQVRDARGAAVRDAVVYAVPAGRAPLARRTAVMDQKNRMFIPHVLPVQTGTAVSFPNSDDVRHHVYSFSPAKTFQLPLYKGTPANPVVFDKAGVVTLGCNIHDSMSAFIVVVDTPFFEKTGADGRVTLPDLDAGRYTVHVWVADARGEPRPVSVNLTGDQRVQLSFVASAHARS
ncbi:MAG: methylamine utilization protein [Acidobacteria bacterium]|nr:methylamine utilization protein [Acidobacteriota bacterium]MBV9478521.1 methylamine utilization protein [Acidobacteriota bacterium]